MRPIYPVRCDNAIGDAQCLAGVLFAVDEDADRVPGVGNHLRDDRPDGRPQSGAGRRCRCLRRAAHLVRLQRRQAQRQSMASRRGRVRQQRQHDCPVPGRSPGRKLGGQPVGSHLHPPHRRPAIRWTQPMAAFYWRTRRSGRLEPCIERRRCRERVLDRSSVAAIRHKSTAGQRGDRRFHKSHAHLDGGRNRDGTPRIHQPERKRREKQHGRQRPGYDHRDIVPRLSVRAGQDLLLACR